jgi:putative PEP-CTERM system histidine kinase
MTFNCVISFVGAAFCAGLAVFVLFRDRHSFVYRTFAIGMVVLAFEATLNGLGLLLASPNEIIRWQHFRTVATAFLPGIWLLFALSYGRANYKEIIRRWRRVLVATFIIPLALITIFGKALFIGEPVFGLFSGWQLRLGWSGYVFDILLLIGAVLILMNLERTFRASAGAMRWQIKFMALGLGSLFAVRIYTSSQSILFYTLNTALYAFNASALIIASVFIAISLVRSRLLHVDLYPSQTFLYNSIAVLMVGVYLLVVGVLAKVVGYFDISRNFPVEALFVFLAILALTIMIFSTQVRQKMRRLVSRHLKRPRYDYQREWREFTKRTTFSVTMRDLCTVVARMVAETFGISSVTIWLLDELQERLKLGGSTAMTESQARKLGTDEKAERELIRAIRHQQMLIDVDTAKGDWAAELKHVDPNYFKEAHIRYCLPLAAGGELLGLMTLNDRSTGEAFSLEDFDLIKTIADQTAGNLLNLKLSERLRQTKEMEAFQTVSAFMMHDLKNLSSTLSLTLENLPVHFDNPEFRNDALGTIQQSVTKIRNMCSQLSLLSQKLELNRAEADLNEIVTSTLSSLNGCVKISLLQDLRPVPRIVVDPEQIKKVLTNLILNANEAVGAGGEIRIATQQTDGWVILSVSDNGCGMSKEFIEKSLFHPFKTTKKRGMGIGLFHSKVIVEAHQGRIEVESEEGRGTTFRVFLPLAGK